MARGLRVRRTWVEGLVAVALVATALDAGCISEDPGASGPPDASQDGPGGLCAEYCETVMSRCATPDTAQYADVGQCLAMCALLPEGQEGHQDNGVRCRLAQAKAATTKLTCAAAGPFGGGVCGTRCQAFCSLVVGNCSQTPSPPYNKDEGTCIEVCSDNLTFDPAQPIGPVGPTSGDTLNCRGMHMRLSLGSTEIHCPHTAERSTVCNAGTDGGHDHEDGGKDASVKDGGDPNGEKDAGVVPGGGK